MSERESQPPYVETGGCQKWLAGGAPLIPPPPPASRLLCPLEDERESPIKAPEKGSMSPAGGKWTPLQPDGPPPRSTPPSMSRRGPFAPTHGPRAPSAAGGGRGVGGGHSPGASRPLSHSGLTRCLPATVTGEGLAGTRPPARHPPSGFLGGQDPAPHLHVTKATRISFNFSLAERLLCKTFPHGRGPESVS